MGNAGQWVCVGKGQGSGQHTALACTVPHVGCPSHATALAVQQLRLLGDTFSSTFHAHVFGAPVMLTSCSQLSSLAANGQSLMVSMM